VTTDWIDSPDSESGHFEIISAFDQFSLQKSAVERHYCPIAGDFCSDEASLPQG
jgi:hypothetical protein